MSKQIAFQGSTFYLFTSGLVALLIVPFLPWLNYGPFSTLFPSQASLVYLFMRGFRVDLTLYLTGVGTTIIAAAVARRPVFFQGILSAVFPLFTIVSLVSVSFVNHFPGYLEFFTPGVFTALLGSVLFEASYLSYRKKLRKQELTTGLTKSPNIVPNSPRN